MEKRKKSDQKPAAAASSKRKRNSESSFCTLQLQQADAKTIFALLVAALSNVHKPKSLFLIRKCLNKIRCSFYSETSSFTPILALFPELLISKCSGIVCRSADIVGAASLASFEMNREIVSDCETLECLVALLASSKRRVRLSSCNAVLDLSTTEFGQQQLLKFSALEKLMFVLLQIPKFSKNVSLFSDGNRSVHCLKIRIKKDELSVAILSAAIILLNACSTEQLQNIPISLSEAFLTLLKELWAKVRDCIAISGAMKSHEEGHLCKSNIGVSNLAESIFRLSINAPEHTSALPFQVVKRSLFGMGECSFEDFISNQWEVSPFLLSRRLKNLEGDDLFSPFLQSMNWTGTVPTLFSNLQGLISCFPIASDEQDILNFLKEVKDQLGCPIIYNQDIRVVKTERHLRKEVHFFQDFDSECLKEPHFFTFEDVFECVEAYKEGYTVALRGLEFRYQSIAAIADVLAFMFGQPSVGANLYLTPPSSQGLACHCDDHCVFVCQIFGSKQWRVFSHPSGLLPRLYDELHVADVDGTTSDSTEFMLREGDVLYIPRGFPHEAYTYSGGDDGVSGFSLHLTLSVEVEAPFEWGGVAHLALHCWNENQKGFCYDGLTPLSQTLNLVSVNLLHVAIRILSNYVPTFRKACLAAAVSVPPDVYNNQLVQSHRKFFWYIIDKINTESRFVEVISSMEVAIQKNEDLFQQISWLWHLDMNKDTGRGNDQNQPFKVEDMLSYYAQHKDEVESAFQDVKSRFCNEVSFEGVIISYRILLQKYRKTRKQYMNGMISLHEKL